MLLFLPGAARGDTVLFFPYQVVEGSAAKDGLWEAYHGLPITRAKPIALSRAGTDFTVKRTFKVTYRKDPEDWSPGAPTMMAGRPRYRQVRYDRDLEIEVCEVVVRADNLPGGFKELRGFVLKEQLR